MMAVLALTIFAGVNVFASTGDSIYLAISPPMSTRESKGAAEIYNAHGYMKLSGNNLSSSHNRLRVMSKRDISWSPDETAAEYILNIGDSNYMRYKAVEGGTYYIRLENYLYAITRSAVGNATLTN